MFISIRSARQLESETILLYLNDAKRGVGSSLASPYAITDTRRRPCFVVLCVWLILRSNRPLLPTAPAYPLNHLRFSLYLGSVMIMQLKSFSTTFKWDDPTVRNTYGDLRVLSIQIYAQWRQPRSGGKKVDFIKKVCPYDTAETQMTLIRKFKGLRKCKFIILHL